MTENEYLVEFKKPFKWEDKEYKTIDLAGMEDLTGRQLCDIHKAFDALGIASALKEQSPEFACIVANTVTKIPVEFFKELPAKELNKVKNKVFTYFFSED
jgi:hypothetical protein